MRLLRSTISLTLVTFVVACSGETGNAGNNTSGFGFDDGAVSSDTASDSTTGASPGSAGCDCKDNGDCDSGICIDNANSANASGKECAQTCVDSCETGFKCATTSIGGEPVAICLPAKGNLCHPCSAS